MIKETKKNPLRPLTAAFLLFLLFSMASPVGAAGERVHIAVSEAGSFDFEEQLFYGYGGVEITYQDVVLKGRQLVINLATGELELRGDVVLSHDGQELSGSFLVYNLETGEGSLSEAASELELPEKTGSIFISGEAVHISDQVYQVQNAQFTTCDHTDSHYHVAAKELELYVGEKVVIRRVTYYEGKIPLFYWPYLVIPLDMDIDERFVLPVFGFSEREGYYMKTTINYQLSSEHYGSVYLDLFSRLGVAAGVRHNYVFDTLGTGSIYLYHLPHQMDPIWEAAWKHGLEGENWSLSTDTSYKDSWQTHSLSTTNRLTVSLPKLSAEGKVTYRNNPNQRESEFLEFDGRWRHTLTDSWQLDLRGNWTERVRDGQTMKLLNYRAQSIYKQDKHTFRLTAEQQYNPDLLTDQVSAWRTVQRLPELEWEMSDLGLSGLPLRSNVQIGRYGERPSLVIKDRVLAQLTLPSRTLRPASGISINYRGDGGAAFYSGGDRQSWLTGRISLDQRLSSRLSLNNTYEQRLVWGESPFRFDAKKPTQRLRSRLTYTELKGSLTLSGGYDFLKKQYDYLALVGSWRSSEKWNMALTVYYDPNSRSIPGILPMVEYKTGDTLLKAAVNYSPVQQVLKRVDAQISLPLGEHVKVGYAAIYEPPKKAFSRGQITLDFDLHCRTISAAYDHVKGRVAFQYTIKAFPTLPIGWDSQDGLEMFKLDDIASVVGEGE